jgi:hypothetical protein
MERPIVEFPVYELAISCSSASSVFWRRPRKDKNFDRQGDLIQDKQGQTMQPTVSSDVPGKYDQDLALCFRISVGALIFFIGCLLLGRASAQETTPTPTTTPEVSPTPVPADQQQSTETVSPTPTTSPTPSPQQPSPLLPQPNALPSPPPVPPAPPNLRDLIPQPIPPATPGATPNPGSAEQQDIYRVRFRQLRTIAARDPYARYLLRRAQNAPDNETKRAYMRVYYITMCDEMRKLEPRMKALIDGFEAGYVARYSPVGTRPTIPERDMDRFRASQRRVTEP